MSKLSRRALLATAAGLVAVGGPIARAASTRTSGSSKFDVERFIDEVTQAQGETDRQGATHEVLARVVAEPRGVLASLGQPSEVGIHALYRAPNLTILNVIWAPMMVLVPHDHRMWATIGIYTGREDNILWNRDGELVKASSATAVSERQVFDLPETAIHSVVNPIPRLTGAIHIYGGDFFGVARSSWDSETLQEHPLDLQATQRSFREANERFKCTQG